MNPAHITLLPVLLALCANLAEARWGAITAAESKKPDDSFASNFPTNPTVYVNQGDNFYQKIAECDQKVGFGAYCTMYISGQPASSFSVTRSRTMITGNLGVTLTSPKENAFVYIGSGYSEIVVQQLNIQGSSQGGSYQVGIEISGNAIDRVIVRNCKIHDYSFANSGGSRNTHGIVVRGTGSANVDSVKNIVITKNVVFSMDLGSSEAITVAGNIRKFLVSWNDVYDINNIAIDAVGGEGHTDTKIVGGRVFPGDLDVARLGWIEDNFVGSMSTKGNPAYPGGTEAAAIYVDGGRNIVVRNNVVENSEVAYEIGAENCVVTSEITFDGNYAAGSSITDLKMGGYNSVGFKADSSINCNPKTSSDDSEGHGYVRRITVENNFLKSSKPVTLEMRLTEAIIIASTVEPVNTENNGFASGDENAILTSK